MESPPRRHAPARVAEVLAAARRDLAAAPFAPSTREAALLLAHLTGDPETRLLAHGEATLDGATVERFTQLLQRRLTGEPVAYLLGRREFYGRDFAVDHRVLIPRPETEHLVTTVLGLDLPAAPRILDIGTGSGAIAVTLALELPGAQVVASDRSIGALAVARGNVRRHGMAAQVAPVAADLTTALALGAFDVVVSNPPYLDPGDAVGLSIEVCAFEPHLALFSPDRGASTLERLIAAGCDLRPGVRLVVEIGAGQLPTIRTAVATSALELVAVHSDYAGIDRVVVLRRRRTTGS